VRYGNRRRQSLLADDLVTWATIRVMEGDALLLRWLKGFKQDTSRGERVGDGLLD